MDKSSLEKRLKSLEESFDQTIANANALSGAIKECKYWIKALEKPKQKEMLEKTN